MKTEVISFSTAENFSESFLKDYLQYRCGSKEILHEFGGLLSTMFDLRGRKYAIFDKNIEKEFPSLQDLLLEEFLKTSSEKFSKSGVEYRKLNILEYPESISSLEVLIFFDDVRFDDTSEIAILEVLKKMGLESDVIFLYFVESTGNEHQFQLDRYAAMDLIENLVKEEKFLFNETTIRWLYGLPYGYFTRVLSTFGKELLEKTKEFSLHHGFEKSRFFQDNYGGLLRIIKHQ